MTRRHNNSLISFGGPTRGRRHHTTKDVLNEGMKYGAAFGIAREGFKAWGNHQNNNQQQHMMMQQPTYQPVYQQAMQRGCEQSPPTYQQFQQEQSRRQSRQIMSQADVGRHQVWCNGQCSDRCNMNVPLHGEAASYYAGAVR